MIDFLNSHFDVSTFAWVETNLTQTVSTLIEANVVTLKSVSRSNAPTAGFQRANGVETFVGAFGR